MNKFWPGQRVEAARQQDSFAAFQPGTLVHPNLTFGQLYQVTDRMPQATCPNGLSIQIVTLQGPTSEGARGRDFTQHSQGSIRQYYETCTWKAVLQIPGYKEKVVIRDEYDCSMRSTLYVLSW